MGSAFSGGNTSEASAVGPGFGGFSGGDTSLVSKVTSSPHSHFMMIISKLVEIVSIAFPSLGAAGTSGVLGVATACFASSSIDEVFTSSSLDGCSTSSHSSELSSIFV